MDQYPENFQGGYNAEDGFYYAKGSYDNAVEYNNEIICLANTNHAIIEEVHQRAAEQDLAGVRALLPEWHAELENLIQNLRHLGPYEGDERLYCAAENYFTNYKNLIDNELTNYLNAVANLANTEASQLEALNLQYATRQSEIEGQLSAALREFLTEYHEDSDHEDEDMYYPLSDAPMQAVEYDENNPLLQPVHGISLYDYAAACAKIANGMPEDQVARCLGVEMPQWDEANQLWQKRMEQDQDFTVAGLFGQYFAMAENHPAFAGVTSDFKVNEQHLQRISTDPLFYHELSGAMQAAYENGIDGAQWLRENYGLSIGDFQSVAMQWAMSPGFAEMIGYQEEKKKEYAKKFTEESGGGVADDIEF